MGQRRDYTGKTVHPPDVTARVPKIRKRLEKSVSGYIRVVKFSIPDRAALTLMLDDGEVEIFDSPLGSAYRLLKKEVTPCK